MTDPNPTNPGTSIATLRSIGVPVTHLANPEVPDEQRLCSFGPGDEDFEELLFASEEAATKQPEQFKDTPFECVHWSAKPITFASEDTGEAVRSARLVLVSPEGETLAFASQGALRSWDLIRTCRGDGPYNPPLRIVVAKVILGGKKFTWRLRPLK